ncbi:MAG: sugar phosphate isomerase/epimerase [Pirellulales bacterium]|nr:sugar phosphate isomerase/epimerase [Pirellulales bacterium]
MSTNLTRRTFLAAGAAAATTFATRTRLVRAAEPDTSKYGGFLMGLQTYSLRGFGAEQALDYVKELGLHSVELFEAHFPSKSSADEIDAMKSRLKSLAIQPLAHGVNPFTKDHEANRRWFEFAKRAGIRNITANPSEDSFDSLDKLVAEYDIRIAIHNHGPGAEYNKVADVLNAVKGRHPNIGACADLGHYIRSAEDPVRVINLLEGRLFGIHLKDFAEQKSQTHGVILGQGHLDIVGVFKALKKVNYPADACLALEYEEKPENPLDDIRACLAAASDGARKAAG